MPTRVKLDKGRASLQKSAMERFGSPEAGGQISVWLLVIDPGHLRVLSSREIGDAINLDELSGAEALELQTRQERHQLAGLRMRLIPTEIVPERRLKIPAEAFDVSGEYVDRSHVWLEQSPSSLEVYTATYVQTVLSIPPSELLQGKFEAK